MRRLKVGTAVELLRIFWPNFVEVDGSIFLDEVKLQGVEILAKVRREGAKALEPYHDLTGLEEFLNHTHMIDLFKHGTGLHPISDEDDYFYDQDHPDFAAMCEVGKTLAQMWYQKLMIDFPQYDFRVYYTQDSDPIVRFHRVRPDQANWLDEEKYSKEIQQGRVVILDTRNASLSNNEA